MPNTAGAPSVRMAPDRHTPSAGGLGPGSVGELQRARLLTAMVKVAAERGMTNVSVAQVISRSGLSRRTFYEQFVDREDCFLAAVDLAIERIAAVVVPAYRQPSKWRERIRAGLTALLDYLDSEPNVSRLVIVEALGAGPKGLERRRQVLAQIALAINEGRRDSKMSGDRPPLTAEGLVGGAFSLIHARVLAGGEDSLIELLNPLMSMIVLPYLGAAAADSEMRRPVAAACKNAKKTPSDPLSDLEMRLTYRTMRVLLAVGAGSGASNRQVADAAGIRDQGQISKLLARLRDVGLVKNIRGQQKKGEANVWILTETGAEVQEVISLQTSQQP